ncbi:universal stress protein [Streptomyces sp. NPDC048664]|uniref:universal stress protein n=1 Tax=Streptomyces sp. NPDC048664 TaxID=3154505 RepID=UPI00343A1DDC
MSGTDALSGPRVVVGVSGSTGSLAALRWAEGEARRRGAALWPVLAWEPPGGDVATRRGPGAAVMCDAWQDLARTRLVTALGEVFGDGGPGVPTHALVARGVPGMALLEVADREGDVLVVGAGRRGPWRRACRRSVSRYCLAHAVCPVLAVPPSPLEAALAAAHRRNRWRLGLDTGRLEKEAARALRGRPGRAGV